MLSHVVAMNTAGVIVIIVILLLVAAAIGWVVFTRMRAARLGVSSFLFFLLPSVSSVDQVHLLLDLRAQSRRGEDSYLYSTSSICIRIGGRGQETRTKGEMTGPRHDG